MTHKLMVDFPTRIETGHLYLRSYQAGDGPMYYAASLRNREHLAEFESGNVLMQIRDEEHAEIIVRELAADWVVRTHFFIGIFEKETDDWVGQVYVKGTNWDLPEFYIGYAADVNYEGKGLMSEAVRGVLKMLFEEVGAHRVKSDCNDKNVRSWHLLERCGFTREGHLREHQRNPDGSYSGAYLYGLLEGEYKGERKKAANYSRPQISVRSS